MYGSMILTSKQIAALIAWANEGDRKGGTTAWGPKFDAAMEVAQDVRARDHDPFDNVS